MLRRLFSSVQCSLLERKEKKKKPMAEFRVSSSSSSSNNGVAFVRNADRGPVQPLFDFLPRMTCDEAVAAFFSSCAPRAETGVDTVQQRVETVVEQQQQQQRGKKGEREEVDAVQQLPPELTRDDITAIVWWLWWSETKKGGGGGGGGGQQQSATPYDDVFACFCSREQPSETAEWMKAKTNARPQQQHTTSNTTIHKTLLFYLHNALEKCTINACEKKKQQPSSWPQFLVCAQIIDDDAATLLLHSSTDLPSSSSSFSRSLSRLLLPAITPATAVAARATTTEAFSEERDSDMNKITTRDCVLLEVDAIEYADVSFVTSALSAPPTKDEEKKDLPACLFLLCNTRLDVTEVVQREGRTPLVRCTQHHGRHKISATVQQIVQELKQVSRYARSEVSAKPFLDSFSCYSVAARTLLRSTRRIFCDKHSRSVAFAAVARTTAERGSFNTGPTDSKKEGAAATAAIMTKKELYYESVVLDPTNPMGLNGLALQLTRSETIEIPTITTPHNAPEEKHEGKEGGGEKIPSTTEYNKTNTVMMTKKLNKIELMLLALTHDPTHSNAHNNLSVHYHFFSPWSSSTEGNSDIDLPDGTRVTSKRDFHLCALKHTPHHCEALSNLAHSMYATERVSLPDGTDVTNRDLFALSIEVDPRNPKNYRSLAFGLGVDEIFCLRDGSLVTWKDLLLLGCDSTFIVDSEETYRSLAMRMKRFEKVTLPDGRTLS